MELFATTSSGDGDSIRVWDLHTGAELWSRKDCSTQPHTLAAIGEDIVVAAAAAKNEFRFWSFSSTAGTPNQGRCSAMEKIECLATTSDGMYCAGGSASGKLYIWDTASGAMLRYWDAHYSAVNALGFTDDNLCLISAERHAYIRAWRLAELLDVSERARARQPAAFRVWTDHTLPVTDLSIGVGGAACRVISASLDQTVKIWCLASGDLVATVVFPTKCMAVTTDPAERDLYVGGSDGVVYPVSLSGVPLHESWPIHTTRPHAAPLESAALHCPGSHGAPRLNCKVNSALHLCSNSVDPLGGKTRVCILGRLSGAQVRRNRLACLLTSVAVYETSCA